MFFIGIFNVMDSVIKIYIFFCYDKRIKFSMIYSLMFVIIGLVLVLFFIYILYLYIWVLENGYINFNVFIEWKFVM